MATVDIQEKLDKVKACIHCGMCLSSCPTYLVTGNEGNSPRGRLYLIRDLIEEQQSCLNKEAQEYLDNCLSCLACETACPSGVEYGSILEYARHEKKQNKYNKGFFGFIRYLAFKFLLPNRKLMRLFRPFIKISPKITKLQPKLEHKYKTIKENKIYNSETKLEELLASEEGRTFFKGKIKQRLEENHIEGYQELLKEAREFLNSLSAQNYKQIIEITHKNILNIVDELRIISLPLGCVMDTVYNHVHWDSIKLLNAFAYHCYIPVSNCCGALASHSGEYDLGYKQLEETIGVLQEKPYDTVMNSAGCGAFLKDHSELNSYDLIEAINQAPISLETFKSKLSSASGTAITYHPACHLNHAQGIKTEYIDLLKAIPDLEIKELYEADVCCGSAGFYNLIKSEMANEIGQRKAGFIKNTGVQTLVTANPGCISQIQAHLGSGYKVKHPASLIAEHL